MSYSAAIARPSSIRHFLLGKVALPSVLIYRKLFKRHKIAWNVNRQKLGTYDDGSIGKSLSNFLYQNEIDIEDKMENHDFFHVVLDYGTSLPEEAAIHFFLIGNGKKSHYPIIAAFVGFLFFPEHLDLYIDAYHRGRKSKHFVGFALKSFLHVPVGTFKETFQIPERSF